MPVWKAKPAGLLSGRLSVKKDPASGFTLSRWKAEQKIKQTYKDARRIRFSCAYLFRIKINDEYFLVKDEQGRGLFQPVGGVYKYTDDRFLTELQADQCLRFGSTIDLDSDLRIIVPRGKVKQFECWYRKEQGRETLDNLYREFQEEVLDRIGLIDDSVFKTISYCYIGEHIEASRWEDNNVQLHIADIVELRLTPQQKKEFAKLREHESNIYRFATEQEIYNQGRALGKQVASIAPHTIKMLEKEEASLITSKRSGHILCCRRPAYTPTKAQCDWRGFRKTDMSKPFTFISYQSDHKSKVWEFCQSITPPLDNIWIDRKEVAELWIDDVKKALASGKCERAIMFINRQYLIRSTPCYEEASLVVSHNIPHVVVLMDMDVQSVQDIIKTWIENDSADKEKLKVFKKLFHYNDDNTHLECSCFSIPGMDKASFLQALENLCGQKDA